MEEMKTWYEVKDLTHDIRNVPEPQEWMFSNVMGIYYPSKRISINEQIRIKQLQIEKDNEILDELKRYRISITGDIHTPGGFGKMITDAWKQCIPDVPMLANPKYYWKDLPHYSEGSLEYKGWNLFVDIDGAYSHPYKISHIKVTRILNPSHKNPVKQVIVHIVSDRVFIFKDGEYVDFIKNNLLIPVVAMAAEQKRKRAMAAIDKETENFAPLTDF